MGLRYRVSLPGPFYYSGRVGPERRLTCSSCMGSGLMGFIVKWFIVYPGVVFFGAGLVIMVAPFYGVFWVVRRRVWNRRRIQPVVQRFPVQPVSYGFVPAQRPVLSSMHSPLPVAPRG